MRLLKKTAILTLLLLPVCLTACAVRTVYVTPGQPVRLAEPVKAKVWVAGADGVWVLSTFEIPEGWYALSDPGKH